jgi:hypothetical protein
MSMKRGPEPGDLFPAWLELFAKHQYHLAGMLPAERGQVRIRLERLRIEPWAPSKIWASLEYRR